MTKEEFAKNVADMIEQHSSSGGLSAIDWSGVWTKLGPILKPIIMALVPLIFANNEGAKK